MSTPKEESRFFKGIEDSSLRVQEKYFGASSEEFGNLCSSIYEANSRAFSNSGREPTEVWLGPREAKILEEEIKRHHVAHGASPQVSTEFAATRANMEGVQIEGLYVRLMVKDGVRVGTTWPKQS